MTGINKKTQISDKDTERLTKGKRHKNVPQIYHKYESDKNSQNNSHCR